MNRSGTGPLDDRAVQARRLARLIATSKEIVETVLGQMKRAKRFRLLLPRYNRKGKSQRDLTYSFHDVTQFAAAEA